MPKVTSLEEREERTVIGRILFNSWDRLRSVLTTSAAPQSGMPNEGTSGSESEDFRWADVLRADAGLPARMM